MSRHSVAGLGSVVGTNVRAIASIFGVSGRGGALREVGVFNTTATAFKTGLIRFSAATNVGSGLTEAQWWPLGGPTQCTAFAGHTGDGTTTGGLIRQGSVGAAIGAGVIWTFGDTGLILPGGTADGIGIIVPSGTGQIADFYFDWDE